MVRFYVPNAHSPLLLRITFVSDYEKEMEITGHCYFAFSYIWAGMYSNCNKKVEKDLRQKIALDRF